MVEFALAAPIMFAVLMGIAACSIAFNNYIQLTEATSTAARQLAVSRAQTLDPCATVAGTIVSSAPLLDSTKFTYKLILNGDTYTGSTCVSSDYNSGASGDLVQGGTATVWIKYPCNLVIYGVNYAPGCTLQAKMTELVQ